jgi:hypothetical protein
VTRDELDEQIALILLEYPWFTDYPIDCHESCARWEIADEFGEEAANAWDEWRNAKFLLGDTP